MSDEGEKTCPLCAEEMDLTDRQLKPCKCGYEICVWCWHQIMDMAEKDETEGKCPACRTPYNKEKIVGMAAKCERLVAEMNVERKVKSQKAKSKTCEGRKDLSNVRVIQRNLVYIVGLPLDLADEDLLQHREYFGQYGKVLKVSISRTAAGAIQHFPNDTCSVYITYSKEDEAVRCIQSVHGFTLEGRSLRACFGTTKYCHAWLRSVPCSNPDCLYLHEIGSQEDSFTKDEIISAYTRVQHITGATIDMQRRSGNMLPPPADEYCINGSSSPGKPTSKIVANNPAISVRGSPPNSSSGGSGSLPAAAAWGMRASNSHPPASLACSNGPSKQKPDTCRGSLANSVAVASPTQVSILHCDVGKNINEENQMTQQKGKLEQLEPMTRYMDIGKQINEENRATQQKGKLEQLEPIKQYMSTDHRGTASETPATPELPATLSKNRQFCTPVCTDRDKSINVPLNSTNSFDLSYQASGPGPGKDLNHAAEAKIQNLCSNMLSTSVDRHRGLQRCDAKQSIKPLVSLAAERAVTSSKDVYITREPSDLRSDSLTQVAQAANHKVEEDLLSFDDRFKDPEVVTHQGDLRNLSQSFHLSNDSRGYQPLQAHGSVNVNVDPQVVDKEVDKGFLSYASKIPVISNGYPEYPASSSSDWNSVVDHSYLLPNEEKMKHVGRFEDEQAKVDCNAAVDMGESSIISNILSMDFDTWDESLTSPQNFAKLLGETDKQQGSLRLSSSRKVQNSNQSRFSFAREEECVNQVSDVEPSLSNIGQALKNRPYSHDLINNRDFHLDKLGYCNGLSSVCVEEPDNFSGSHSHISLNKFSVSRTQISAPPGFSVPSRAPPPGFTSHERMEQAFDTESGNHLLDTSFLLRKPYQALQPVNIGSTGDIEFMDPAILAVGKGRLSSPGLDMRTNFPPQLNSYENEAKLQLLMQRSLSPHQNQRYTEMGDSFSNSSRTDAYGIPSRVMEQMFAHNLSSPLAQLSPPQSRNVPLSNGHWDGWNEVQSGNDLRMAQLHRNERLGFNKFYTGYEDSKFRTPSSTDLYNRTFGI